MDSVDPAWLERAERLFKAARVMVAEVPRRYPGWTPEPGSRADADFVEVVVADAKQNRALVQMPRVLASLHLRTAVEYLAGVGALFREGEVRLNPGALTRSAFESAIRGFLVLDPSANGREQRARALVYEITSAERFRAATIHLVGKLHSAYPLANRAWRSMIELAETEFAGEIDSQRTTIAGQTVPTMDDGARAWAEWRRSVSCGSTIGEEEAGGYYDFLCLHTHPQGFTSHQSACWSGDADDEPGFGADPVELAKLTLVTHACVMDLARVFYDYHGWESFELDLLAELADELWLEPREGE
jgi:hypothetical protein